MSYWELPNAISKFYHVTTVVKITTTKDDDIRIHRVDGRIDHWTHTTKNGWVCKTENK